MYRYAKLEEFYKGKRVLITGHTGFKGSWLCSVLISFGAEVIGYSLTPPTNPALFDMLEIDKEIKSVIGDIRDLDAMRQVFEETQPEIVIHMAAQPIVRESYKDPVGTYSTNVMGTVNLMECCRHTFSVKSVVNVTTDKVYRNNEWDRGYVETDFLDGYDPYSNSKSCSELVTHSYIQSFFSDNKGSSFGGPANRVLPVSTCRAGNVIGGGDFAKDRIIPDCVRAAEEMEDIIVRNPYSTRPYEHVLEPLFVYLMIAKEQYEDVGVADSYNVGPDDASCVTTGELVDIFIRKWNKRPLSDCEGNPRPDIKWTNKHDGGPHEAGFLKLDCTKLKNKFDWSPVWDIDTTMDKVTEWYRGYLANEDIKELTQKQIRDFITN